MNRILHIYSGLCLVAKRPPPASSKMLCLMLSFYLEIFSNAIPHPILSSFIQQHRNNNTTIAYIHPNRRTYISALQLPSEIHKFIQLSVSPANKSRAYRRRFSFKTKTPQVKTFLNPSPHLKPPPSTPPYHPPD